MKPSFARAAAGAALLCALGAGQAQAHRPLPPAHHARTAVAPLKPEAASAGSGAWTPVGQPFPGVYGPDTALLLTDGTVIMHDLCTPNWYRLTPDASGSYVNGTWSAIAPMPGKYAPLYFASQVLIDGRVIVNGGEYADGCQPEWTDQGALYDPVADVWTSVAPPPGWTAIGDAQSVVLPDGRYMLANATTSDEAIATISGNTVTWTPTGAGKADINDEEAWTILPYGTLLTVDTNNAIGQPVDSTEIYDTGAGTWSAGRPTRNRLVDPQAHEIGPSVMMPDGKVFQAGASSCGAPHCVGHTGLYRALTGGWTAGPDFPSIDGANFDVSDGPAALLPDGNVLVQASPNYDETYESPSHFFEFDGQKLNRVAEPASAPSIAAYEGRMLLLPTGQVLWSSDVGDVEVYTSPGVPKAAWAPKITSAPSVIARGGKAYVVRGSLFNGLSQGAGYGDDVQQFTNYPLVRITNVASGRVCFARTHAHSSMGISHPGEPGFTHFDVPAAEPAPGVEACDPGPSKLQVIVNGIASKAVAVTVQ